MRGHNCALADVSEMYSVYVEDFMVRDVKYIWHGMSYGKLKEVLKENRNLRGFPLVDNPGECSLCWALSCSGKDPLIPFPSPRLLFSCFYFSGPHSCY
jgi:hypothetical protein